MEYLDFEQPIKELEEQMQKCMLIGDESEVDMSDACKKIEKKLNQVKKDIYGNLTAWQRVQISRHLDRPYTLDYIKALAGDTFLELHGDRTVKDDKAMIGGFGKIDDQSFLFIGQQKGVNTKMRQYRNFGMANPEGYRKALRLMQTAEKFNIPVMTFVDTPGAYPGIGAEERGQSEAIGRNLYELTRLRVPVLCTIIGEGGSGGALAIAVGDYVNMLQYSTYSVISPEGCASILWKTAEKAADAAQALGITAKRLQELDLIDSVISEPLGGAHRDFETTMKNVKTVLETELHEAQNMPMADLLSRRFDRIMAYGKFTDK